MMRKLLPVIAVAVVVFFGLVGCGGKDSEPAVKSEAEYKTEAGEQINEQNMDAELDKLETEIETEIRAEPEE